MEDPDLQPRLHDFSRRAEEQAASDALAARIREALNRGDHDAAQAILTEASARFPNDAELLKLQHRHRIQVQRVARAHVLLAEVRAANEDLRFVQALGAFREAANLSREPQFLREATFETGLEEAGQLTPHNWRVAQAFLSETSLLDPQRPLPNELLRDIDRAEQEEHALHATERLSTAKQAAAKIEAEITLQERSALLAKLTGVRDEMARADYREDAEQFIARGEAAAGPYRSEPEFAAILREITGRISHARQLAALHQSRGLFDEGLLIEAQAACRQAIERFPECAELWALETEIQDRISFFESIHAPEVVMEPEVLDAPETIAVLPPSEEPQSESAAANALIEVELHPARRLFKRALGLTVVATAASIVVSSLVMWRVYSSRVAETPKHVLEIPSANSARATGTLTVRLDVPDAQVFVNGQKYVAPKGSAGLAFRLPADTYKVLGVHPGYDDSAPVMASIQKDSETVVDLHLNPKPATLEIRGAEPGTKVAVDGVPLHPAAGVLRAGDLAPGRHVIELTRDGFSKKTMARRFSPGEMALLSGPDIQLQSTDASVLAPEPREWERASRSMNVSALEDFIRKYPDSIHVPAAKSDVQLLQWQNVDKSDADALHSFATSHPENPYSGQAQAQAQRIAQARALHAEQSDWEALDKENKAALASFLARHPGGSHAAAATTSIAELDRRAAGLESQRAEDAAWRLVDTRSRASLHEYVAQFPQGRHRPDAQEALADLNAVEVSAAESAAVLDVIRRFANAWNTKDLDSIVAIQRDLNRRSLKAQLAPAKSVAMRISPVGPPEIKGAQAIVRCRRQADETFADGSIHQNPESIVTYVLAKRNGAWGIEEVR